MNKYTSFSFLAEFKEILYVFPIIPIHPVYINKPKRPLVNINKTIANK